ncbi:MAG: wax ester/triacylglycerol synthase family O-acyltransferase [Myxococcota bacterium]|nr:wax ester/triacylglycerol synthase family O-acyltransferase [Myxococcota bacterium]
MAQLDGSDAVFLSMETPEAPGHVGGVTILDPSTAREFSFERLVAHVDERVRLEPRYTRKLREVPLGVDRPYLVDDPDFDASRHIKRIAVPSPGGMREIADLVGELFRRPLDRDRPLWEMWFIEGVEKGRVAMLMKSHHCLMDGMASAGLGELLCDLEPEPENGPILPLRADRAPAPEPSALEVLGNALRNRSQAPLKLARFLGRMARQTAAMAIASARDDEAPPLPGSFPAVSFNAPLGPRRGFSCASVPLEDVKNVKKHFDVTVNDVVLAITGSAVRRYLEQRGELPEQSLVAAIAISTRTEGDDRVNNSVTMVPVGWATDLADPAERLQRIHRNAEKAKEFSANFDADMMAGIGESLAPGVVGLLMRSSGDAAVSWMPANVVVSNVRGTPVPLYTAGAKIECMYPLSVLAPSQGLNITVVSYMGRVDVGFTVDPDLVPDAWALADGIVPALEELEEAARARVRGAA